MLARQKRIRPLAEYTGEAKPADPEDEAMTPLEIRAMLTDEERARHGI